MTEGALAADLRGILDYLELAPTSTEIQRITGLSAAQIEKALRGDIAGDAERREHIAIVASVVGDLAAVRVASTGSRSRGQPAADWLRGARVETSRGILSPLELLSDPLLAREALDLLRR